MTIYFDHEKLNVYQISLSFVAWAGELLESMPQKAAVKDQLDRTSTSIPLNIAEGNGKSSIKERCRFLEIARGSAVESAACLDVIVARKFATDQAIVPGKEMLRSVVSMLIKLISNLSTRVNEEGVEYLVEVDYQPQDE